MMERTILIVDDEEDICQVLDIALSDLGYEVFTASNGVEAMTTYKQIEPAIVLTDVRMPAMDGMQLLRKIKEYNADTEVIMITGHADIELAIESLKYEATDFITKPIKHEVLQIALKRALERITMRRKLKEYTENLEELVREKSTKLVKAERMAAIGETIAALSHSIKNISGGLEGGRFVLEKGIELKEENQIIQGWEMVKTSFEKVKNLSLDLLNYAKATDRENYRWCDPNKPAQEVFDLMQTYAEQEGVKLQLDYCSDLRKVYIDPEGISCSLLNLVTNAIEATSADDAATKEKCVLLRTLRVNGLAVEYQVVDNGCGMDDHIKGKLFNTIFTTKETKGTGIGLMITKKIIDEHRGAIEFESRKGGGSTFMIRLPEAIG